MSGKQPHLKILRSCAAASVVAVLLAAGGIMLRNYRAARGDFEPWRGLPTLRLPQRTGVKDLQLVSFTSPDGIRLAGWYVPSSNRAAIVLTHGTNADRSSMLAELRLLAGAGFGVLAFDWPGDGDSTGTIHWGAGERGALTAAITWLALRPDVDPARIGGLGFSMGGFVMAQVAAHDTRLRAVIIEAAPPDFDDYLRLHHRRWGFLSEWPAYLAVRRAGLNLEDESPVQAITAITPRPVLIIGGGADQVIPPDLVRKLYAAAAEPKGLWIVPDASHGGYDRIAPAAYRRRLLEFFGGHLLR